MSPKVSSTVLPLAIVFITICASIFYWISLIDTQQLEMESARHNSELHAKQISEAVDQEFDSMFRSLDTTLKHLRNVYLHNRKEFERSLSCLTFAVG